MSRFAWDDSISLNVAAIDDQHKALISWIDALYESVQKCEGEQVIGDVLQKLISYVVMHFNEEERLMLSFNYPVFTSHRQEHDYYVTKLKDLQERFRKGEEISGDTLDFMADWIVCHIKGTDQNFGRFLREIPKK